MNFSLATGVPVLQRTPAVLDRLLRGLPPEWSSGTEGPDTWSPFAVVGHLIHGEETDWIPRVELILAYGDTRAFTPFDRFAQFARSQGKTLAELLDRFAELRAANLRRLAAFGLREADLERRGLHPELGPVTLGQLLATWVAHDLDHLVQIARVMGRQYNLAVGPWHQYLRIIESPR